MSDEGIYLFAGRWTLDSKSKSKSAVERDWRKCGRAVQCSVLKVLDLQGRGRVSCFEGLLEDDFSLVVSGPMDPILLLGGPASPLAVHSR